MNLSLRRLAIGIWSDMIFQVRHGFYAAYMVVSTLYIVLLTFIPHGYQEMASVLIVFSDPSFIGCFFIGAIILLEKGQGIYDSLFVTPFQIAEYLLSKLFSLTFLSIISSLAIIGFSISGIVVDYRPIVIGIFLSSLFFTCIGIILAVRVKTVNQFLLSSPLVLIVFFIPVLETTMSLNLKWTSILPSYAGILLIQGGFEPLSVNEWTYGIGNLVAWILVGFYLTYHSFYKYIVLRIGSG
ncbi:hypothetical protein ACFSCX_15710 [Bacillus salitolerans]|uniref:ABC transporter permease n=1 Tax=Bacillus salitolerans TaxID=1437434 RepID=A0ABW4LV38_9BACI